MKYGVALIVAIGGTKVILVAKVSLISASIGLRKRIWLGAEPFLGGQDFLIQHMCTVKRVIFGSWKNFYSQFPFSLPVSEMITLYQISIHWDCKLAWNKPSVVMNFVTELICKLCNLKLQINSVRKFKTTDGLFHAILQS